jgi:hypothetical protein
MRTILERTVHVAAVAVALVPAVWLSIQLAGCNSSRFPVCNSDEQCKVAAADAGTHAAVCFDLKCVECRYDSDCEHRGHDLVCNVAKNTCETVGGGPPPDADGAVEDDPWDSGAALPAPAAAAPSDVPPEDAGTAAFLKPTPAKGAKKKR